jgi:NAD(P)-dependent dehydrogenase (short-subunit alcohol dehydrogenase family)
LRFRVLQAMEISGCTVLVTGGASGIGAAIGDDLRERAARIAVADRDPHDAEIVADLSRPGGARRMVEAAVEELGGLDVLVNNAGGYSPTFPANANWRAPLELNLLAVMEAIRHALPSLARRPGCVVNIASSAGQGFDVYDGAEYAVAKAGLIRLTTALGAVDGVRVNCASPRTVATSAILRALEFRRIVGDRAAAGDAASRQPGRRGGPASHRGRLREGRRGGTLWAVSRRGSGHRVAAVDPHRGAPV